MWGVVAYRLFKRWRRPVVVADPVVEETDDRAEELRARLADARAGEDSGPADPVGQPGEPEESVEERRRHVHEEGRAAIDRMTDADG